MKISHLGLLNNGEVVDYTGDFLIDTVKGVQEFTRVNSGNVIVFDQKGIEYLGPLKGFTNVVVNPTTHYEGVLEANSLEEALSFCSDDRDVYVLAGEKLYGDALNYNLG